ncbi:hypothetical protein KIH39_11725 [Telmatocola sphagniphila]|uniref:Uncharacterized protein n=1 Tax=Telmatocola sphagniphila TaxID=1123043 RepID=A0A8E6B9U5_9BACT|nr:hypothetical protein [Telmatocola sphagniphila]QVL34542.1 hypothetical protein KIH39_11725 [Telmatocola sphagniphila]
MNFCLLVWPVVYALSSSPIALTTEWQTDYSKAKQLALEKHKPLAVFVGEGSDGWKKVSPGTSFDGTINQSLSSNFVCLYVDKATSNGKSLADALQVTEHTGLVISDKDVKLQAFNYSGTVKADELVNVITKFADGPQTVTQTESLAKPVVYTPASAVIPAAYMGGGCPNGNCPKQVQYYYGR